MQIQKINEDKQKIITISLITSDKFCEKIIPIFLDNTDVIYKSFNNFNRIVINWCLEYYKKYNKAPHSQIQDIYNSKKKQLNDDEQDLIKQLLLHLSEKYEREENFNEQYVIDQAKLYIREVNLDILQKEITELKKQDKIEDAEHLVLSYTKIDKETEKRQTTNIFADIDFAKKICEFELNKNMGDRLFKLPGDLGKDLEEIYRTDFVTFAGFGKVGKSFMCRRVAEICACDYGLNVLVFNLEMSHEKYVRNFYQSLSNQIKQKEEKIITIPYFEEQNSKFIIRYKKYRKQGLSAKIIEDKLKLTKIKTKGNIIVESFPSNTLHFNKCVKVLDDYLLKGFVTDVLIIDFLDNLKSFYKGEFRHQIEDKWVSARRLAQEKHIAIVTVTHTSKETLKGNVTPANLTEDYRKYLYITCGIGINQSPLEKEKQYSRLNIIANRDGDYSLNRFYISLECKYI